MIWIPLQDLQFPQGWSEERVKVQAELDACNTRAKRSALLRENRVAAVWGALKDGLAKISNSKCWYCETPIARDDLVVDHYRPKGRIYEEDDTREGYWWLALAYTNFRLCCKYCNERRVDRSGGTAGGKGTHFPLLQDGVRATSDNRYLDGERPAILDPIRPLDPPLLKFLQDSWVQPAHETREDPIKHNRADITICILHLNHGRLRFVRGQVCNAVQEAIERTDLAYRRYLERKGTGASAESIADAYVAYESAFERLAAFVKRTSPYAGAAKSIIRQQAEPRGEWLETILSL